MFEIEIMVTTGKAGLSSEARVVCRVPLPADALPTARQLAVKSTLLDATAAVLALCAPSPEVTP